MSTNSEVYKPLKAPFPYFGGKSRIAGTVWKVLGDVRNYVEPFFGSGACLLQVPFIPGRIETVNDKDGFVSNFWRAIQSDPLAVAKYADWPVNEIDLHARHRWLIDRRESLYESLLDPDWFDAKVAGWWVWGICSWIGSGWCREKSTKRPHLGDAGRGINRQLPHLSDAGQGINRQLPHLSDAGQGINRQLPHLSNAGQGIAGYFEALSDRLRKVRVCCGDWSRVCGPSVTVKHGLTGVFLDPPYSDKAGRAELYAEDSFSVAYEVREWAIEHGDDPDMRIVLCGYEGEYEMPQEWKAIEWKANGGYAGQNKNKENHNRHRERLWCSPHCITPDSELPLIRKLNDIVQDRNSEVSIYEGREWVADPPVIEQYRPPPRICGSGESGG